MEKVYLSDSGPKVSPAIYGFWRWANESATDIKKMEQTVNLCLSLGINTFDHADIYGNYLCEETFGKIIKQQSFKREDIVIFSKCGVILPVAGKEDSSTGYYDTSSTHIIKSVENSLKNLHTDYLDVFFLDHLDPLSNLEETAITLDRLRSSGKIRNVGIANFSVFQHQLLASYLKAPVVTNRVELNLLNTTALNNGQVDYSKQRYMRILAAAPLADGRIEIGADAQAVKTREELEKIAAKYNANIESIAVAWLIKLGALPLIGTLKEQRIRNIVNAFDINLSQQDWYRLYNTTKQE